MNVLNHRLEAYATFKTEAGSLVFTHKLDLASLPFFSPLPRFGRFVRSSRTSRLGAGVSA